MSRTICLCMVVKNEAHVVKRALESALPWIDAWAVTDTGSDDETCAIVADTLVDVPGRLQHTEWIDFATGRTEAFRLAQTMGCDYILMMDADQTVVVESRACLADLDADGYNIEIKHGGVSYPHPWLLKSSLPWYWKGATHEHLACDVAHRAEPLYRLGRGCMTRQAFPTAALFFAQAAAMAMPEGALFVETGVYDYQAAWGLSMVYRLLKRHEEAETWEAKVLAGPRTPAYAVAEVLNSRATRTIGRLPG